MKVLTRTSVSKNSFLTKRDRYLMLKRHNIYDRSDISIFSRYSVLQFILLPILNEWQYEAAIFVDENDTTAAALWPLG